MDNISLKFLVKNEFYKIVDDAQMGVTVDVLFNNFSYVRFHYLEENKLYGEQTIEEYLGDTERIDEVYEAEYSNGTVYYIPTLKVDNKEIFFNTLTEIIEKYLSMYHFSRAIEKVGKNNVVKSIILTIFSNARYVDYELPVSYMNRYIDFFYDTRVLDNYIDDIFLLLHSSIVTHTRKEEFGYETPYYFETFIINGSDKYYLPNINYGISNNKCYIYSIQNKHPHEDTIFSRKIKRYLYKINANLVDDTDYDQKDTILGVPPSFVIVLSIFLKTLKNSGIDNVEVITFLPDRYFEKKACDCSDADFIQNHLAERLVLLFYRIKYHIPDIEIDYPIYDGISYFEDAGEDLVIKLGNNIECNNNSLLEEIFSKMSNSMNKN